MDIGMDIQTSRLFDGDCICDVLVKASAEAIASFFGKPTLVFQEGKLLETVNTDDPDLIACIGKPQVSDWCYVEMNNSKDEDPFISMCKQAIFAIKGAALAATSLNYATPISTAATLSIALQAPAIALWGSDDAAFVGGGAIFDQSGHIQEVYSIGTPEQLKKEMNYFRDLFDGLEPDDDFTDALKDSFNNDEDFFYKYIPGQEAVLIQKNIIDILHTKLIDLQAAQPRNPLWHTLTFPQSRPTELPNIPDSLRQLLEPVYGTFEAYAAILRQEMGENRVNKTDIKATIDLYRQKWFGHEIPPPENRHKPDDETVETDYEAIWIAKAGD